jgi:hypothetical protein
LNKDQEGNPLFNDPSAPWFDQNGDMHMRNDDGSETVLDMKTGERYTTGPNYRPDDHWLRIDHPDGSSDFYGSVKQDLQNPKQPVA